MEKSVSQFACVFVAIIEVIIAFLALGLIIFEDAFIFFAIAILDVTVARFDAVHEIALEEVAVTVFVGSKPSELVVAPRALKNVS